MLHPAPPWSGGMASVLISADAASGGQGRSRGPRRCPTAVLESPCLQARRVERHRRPRPAQPGPGWSLPAGRSRGGTTPAERCATLARPIPLIVAGIRWPERSRHIADRTAHGRSLAACGTREHHPAARMLSIMAATSSISRRSSSSASSAATSAASTARRCSRAALSRIARRIASDLLSPVASSWASARRASSSRRTLMAEDTMSIVSRFVIRGWRGFASETQHRQARQIPGGLG